MSGQGQDAVRTVPAADLRDFVGRLFMAAGVAAAAAESVADGLVEADLEGLPSHGVMLTDMYIERLRKGSVSLATSATTVSDRQGAVVLDAGHALGQLTGMQAMAVAIDKARQFAAGIVSVRHGFHFGAAGRYALQAAKEGCVGIAMCNTRPLMPRCRPVAKFRSCSTWRPAKPRWEKYAWPKRPRRQSRRPGPLLLKD
jgi:LDH2 family malate/lactate/ureidoglycolate dehydrogenase